MARNYLYNYINQAVTETGEQAVQDFNPEIKKLLSGEHVYCPAFACAYIFKEAKGKEFLFRDCTLLPMEVTAGRLK